MSRRNKGDFLSRTHPPVRLPGRKEEKELGKEEGLAQDGCAEETAHPRLWGRVPGPPTGGPACACPPSFRMLTANQGGQSLAANPQAPGSSSADIFLKVQQPVPGDSELCTSPSGVKKPL